MIIAKIDVTKLDKNKFFKGKQKQDGSTPIYADIVLIENRAGTDQYGNDYMVVQSLPKEDREKGVKGAILGNAKTMGKRPEPPNTPISDFTDRPF